MVRMKYIKEKNNIKEKDEVGELMLFDFKFYYIAIVIKKVLYWQRINVSIKQSRVDSPEIDLHKYDQRN